MLISEVIEEKALRHGFCRCIEGPLSFEKLNRDILEFMERDKEKKMLCTHKSYDERESGSRKNSKTNSKNS
jgi:hypothetical protein